MYWDVSIVNPPSRLTDDREGDIRIRPLFYERAKRPDVCLFEINSKVLIKSVNLINNRLKRLQYDQSSFKEPNEKELFLKTPFWPKNTDMPISLQTIP